MLQGGEIIIIAFLALIVLGPTRLPELMRKAGQWTAELRQAARDISKGLENEVAGLKAVGDELTAPIKELKSPLQELTQPFKDIGDDLKSADPRKMEWTGPKPISGPTPEDAMRDLEEIEKVVAESEEESAGPDEDAEGEG
jgi:sec-independent protein translocase protein TatB